MPLEVDATAAHDPQKPAITRRAAAAAMLVLVAIQLLWIVALVLWVIRIV
jgi:hypothetical protein